MIDWEVHPSPTPFWMFPNVCLFMEIVESCFLVGKISDLYWFGCYPWLICGGHGLALSFSCYHWCSLLISITILLKSGNLYTYWCTSVLAFPLSSHLSKKMHLQFVMFWWAWAWVYFTIWVWPCAVKASQVIMTELNFNFFFQPIFQRYPRPAKEYQSFSLIYNERSLDLVQISSHPVFVCFLKENSHRCSLEKSVFSFWVSDAWVTSISWI